jgi:Carboxypeptidase regulatory-like domain
MRPPGGVEHPTLSRPRSKRYVQEMRTVSRTVVFRSGTLLLLAVTAFVRVLSAHSQPFPDPEKAALPASGSLQIPASATTPPAQEQDQPTGSISGKIVDQSGANIVGAVVKLTRENEASSPETTSNDDGLFAFTHVVPGPFRLTISSPGLAPQEFSGTLESGHAYTTPVIMLTIPTQVVEVRVGLTREELAEAQIKEQEKQRVLGIIPNFYVTYDSNPVPLFPKQKFELAWKSASDPITLLGVGVLAGIAQASDLWGAYGQGAQGYAKRFGASYANVFGATFIGGAIMPSLLKQDPRYYYKGTGSKRSRILYALANSVICKGDNGRWQPNYSNIAGSFGGAGLEALYIPANDRRGGGFIVSAALIRLGETSLAGVLQEFVLPRLTPNHATRSNRQRDLKTSFGADD